MVLIILIESDFAERVQFIRASFTTNVLQFDSAVRFSFAKVQCLKYQHDQRVTSVWKIGEKVILRSICRQGRIHIFNWIFQCFEQRELRLFCVEVLCFISVVKVDLLRIEQPFRPKNKLITQNPIWIKFVTCANIDVIDQASCVSYQTWYGSNGIDFEINIKNSGFGPYLDPVVISFPRFWINTVGHLHIIVRLNDSSESIWLFVLNLLLDRLRMLRESRTSTDLILRISSSTPNILFF